VWASLLPSESVPVLRPAILVGGLFALVARQEDFSSNSTRS
jgi:hypothetical protein